MGRGAFRLAQGVTRSGESRCSAWQPVLCCVFEIQDTGLRMARAWLPERQLDLLPATAAPVIELLVLAGQIKDVYSRLPFGVDQRYLDVALVGA